MTESKPQTYLAQAQADAALEAQGRFAAQQRPHIIGTDPIPPPLASPEWSQDAAKVPPEPPLGFAIDEVPGDMEKVEHL